jgi:hypothetical protein
MAIIHAHANPSICTNPASDELERLLLLEILARALSKKLLVELLVALDHQQP